MLKGFQPGIVRSRSQIFGRSRLVPAQRQFGKKDGVGAGLGELPGQAKMAGQVIRQILFGRPRIRRIGMPAGFGIVKMPEPLRYGYIKNPDNPENSVSFPG